MTNLPKSASPSELRTHNFLARIERAQVLGGLLQSQETLLDDLHKYFSAEPRRDERGAAKNPEFIELVRGLMKYALAEDDAKAALLYLFHYGVLQLNSDWTVAARASAAPPLDEILETLKFAKEVIHDQAERFHKGCRCQLCESLPESLQRAVELLEGSKVAVPQPSAGPMYEALREYMTLLDEGCELENRECDCDSDNFHTCETCKEIMGLDYRLRSLRDLWGEKWAIALATMGTR